MSKYIYLKLYKDYKGTRADKDKNWVAQYTGGWGDSLVYVDIILYSQQFTM